MCGRYTLTTPPGELADLFGLEGSPPDLPASYNVAPTQEVAAVLADDGVRRMELLRWGLIPGWADDPAVGARMINARAETAAEKPSFRSAFRQRRCLIPADGFYEWQKTAAGKQPHLIRMKDGAPFAFAGLWESWHQDGGPAIRSCAILTTRPNELVAGIHDRMPVILPQENYAPWLDDSLQDTETLSAMLVSYPAERMEAYPVSRFVNSPANNDERCVAPVA